MLHSDGHLYGLLCARDEERAPGVDPPPLRGEHYPWMHPGHGASIHAGKTAAASPRHQRRCIRDQRDGSEEDRSRCGACRERVELAKQRTRARARTGEEWEREKEFLGFHVDLVEVVVTCQMQNEDPQAVGPQSDEK